MFASLICFFVFSALVASHPLDSWKKVSCGDPTAVGAAVAKRATELDLDCTKYRDWFSSYGVLMCLIRPEATAEEISEYIPLGKGNPCSVTVVANGWGKSQNIPRHEESQSQSWDTIRTTKCANPTVVGMILTIRAISIHKDCDRHREWITNNAAMVCTLKPEATAEEVTELLPFGDGNQCSKAVRAQGWGSSPNIDETKCDNLQSISLAVAQRSVQLDKDCARYQDWIVDQVGKVCQSKPEATAGDVAKFIPFGKGNSCSKTVSVNGWGSHQESGGPSIWDFINEENLQMGLQLAIGLAPLLI